MQTSNSTKARGAWNALQEAWGKPSADNNRDARFDGISILLMTFAVLLGVLLRLDGLGRPAWIDEVYSINYAHKTVGEIFAGNNSPLMPLLSKFVLWLCADDRLGDELFLRVVSAVWGNLTLIILYLYMRARAGNAAALTATLFLAALRAHINISLEARYYALQILFALLLLLSMDRFLRDLRLRDLVAPVLVGALGLLNHMSFAFLWAACIGCAFLCFLLRRDMAIGKRLIAAALVGLFALLPFSYVLAAHPQVLSKSFSQSTESGGEDTETQPTVATAPTARYRLSPADYVSFLRDDPEFLWLGTGALMAFVLLICLAGLVGLAFNHPRFALLLVCVFLLPLPFMIIPANHQWHSRYFCTQFPAYAIVLGHGAVVLKTLAVRWGVKRPWQLAALGATGCTAVCLALAPTRLRQYPERWTAIERHQSGFDVLHDLAQEIHPGDGLILAAPLWPNWSCHTIVRYYTSGAADSDARLPFGAQIYYRWNTNQILDVLSARKPGQDFWVIAPAARGAEQKSLAANGGTLCFSRNGTTLWSFGRATVNMLPDGDFESDTTRALLPPSAEIEIGDGAWRGRSLKVPIPAINSTAPSPRPTVWFPVTRAGANDAPGNALENGVPYVLSFRFKAAGLEAGPKPGQEMQVMLAWNGGKQELLPIQGHLDWNKYSGTINFGEVPEWKHIELCLVPGRNVPADLDSVMIGFANLGMTGTFWLDDVQLEIGTQSSPFTPETRTLVR